MKRLPGFVVLSLLLTAALVSRGQSNNAPTAGDVKRDAKQAVSTAGAYTKEQLREFDKKADNQFRELSKKLDDLKAQSQKQTGDAKAALDKKIAQAQQKIDDLKPKLAELKTATTNAWSDIKSGFEKGLDDVRNALK